SPDQAASASQSQAIARAQQSSGTITSSSSHQSGTVSLERLAHDPAAITARLREFAESFHLVSPATSVETLPPGCGVSITYLTVDPNPDLHGPKEVYDVGGRLGLSG